MTEPSRVPIKPTYSTAEIALHLGYLDKSGKPQHRRARRWCVRNSLPLHPLKARKGVRQFVYLSDLREHPLFAALLDAAHERKLAG